MLHTVLGNVQREELFTESAMKAMVLIGLLTSMTVFATDSLERDYAGVTDKNEKCSLRLRDSEGSASFTYFDDGGRKSCAITYDRYELTNARDDGYSFGTVKGKSSFKSCKVQVYFGENGKLTRLRMGLKSIFSPFHVYTDCKVP